MFFNRVPKNKIDNHIEIICGIITAHEQEVRRLNSYLPAWSLQLGSAVRTDITDHRHAIERHTRRVAILNKVKEEKAISLEDMHFLTIMPILQDYALYPEIMDSTSPVSHPTPH